MGKMSGTQIIEAVVTVLVIVILVPVAALIAGTILANTLFTSLTIINVTYLSDQFGLFVVGLIGFLAIIGTIVGIMWLVSYIKPLFDKKSGLQSLSA